MFAGGYKNPQINGNHASQNGRCNEIMWVSLMDDQSLIEIFKVLMKFLLGICKSHGELKCFHII